MIKGGVLGPLPFDPATLTKYVSVRTWLSSVSSEHTGSDRTRELYLWYFTRWVEWTKKDPDALKDERLLQLRSSDQEASNTLERLLNEYFDYLQSRGVSRNMAAQHLIAIRSFYTSNYGRLRSKQPRQTRSHKLKPPLTEELDKVWQFADVRDRALIAWIKDCGMSRGDIATLRWKDLKREWGKRKDALHIEFVRGKTKEFYETFLGDETIRSLETYMDLRKSRGEQLTFKDDTAVFVRETTPYKPMNEKNIGDAFRALAKKTGVEISAHRLRKYFETYMALAKVNPTVLKYWMGHTTQNVGGDVEKLYIIPPSEEQRKLYLSGYDKLRITLNPEIEEIKLKTELRQKGIDAETEFGKHPNWTSQDQKTWMQLQARQEMSKSDGDDIYYDGIKYANHYYDYIECRYGSQAYRHALMEGYTLMDNGDGDRRTLMKRKDKQ